MKDRWLSVEKIAVRVWIDLQALTDVSVERFVTNCKTQTWPDGARLPGIYYNPRSLKLRPEREAVVHANCVVVDGVRASISHAGFTEATQETTLGNGLLAISPSIASKLAMHFESFVSAGLLKRAGGFLMKGHPVSTHPDIRVLKG